MPVCEACRSPVSEVTREFEDALCDLCLEIQRYDRKIRVATPDATKSPVAPPTGNLPDRKKVE